jgi:DNA polymerase-3 subunit beta
VLRERDVVFRTTRAEVTARLIEGDFPNYEQLIPSGYPNRLTVPREAFVEALDRVQIVGQNRDNAAVRIAMSATGLELSMSAQDVGNAQEQLDAKFEGTELTVAFNPGFLREGVDALESTEVALETIDPLKPATLRAADGGDFLYLLMPVRTS